MFQYTLAEAIKDGYAAPYTVERIVLGERTFPVTALAQDMIEEEADFADELRLPYRVREVVRHLWDKWGENGLRGSKAIIFCIDTTHAAFVTEELNHLAGDQDYAVCITHAEPNNQQLLRAFVDVSARRPCVAVTVEMLAAGVDAPDVRSIVFLRPLRSVGLYQQMVGRGSRLCEETGKRDFRVFDYSGATLLEEQAPENVVPRRTRSRSSRPPSRPEVAETILLPPWPREGAPHIVEERADTVILADGGSVPLDQYSEQSSALIRSVAQGDLDQLYGMWIDRERRAELRSALRSQVDLSLLDRKSVV